MPSGTASRSWRNAAVHSLAEGAVKTANARFSQGLKSM